MRINLFLIFLLFCFQFRVSSETMKSRIMIIMVTLAFYDYAFISNHSC